MPEAGEAPVPGVGEVDRARRVDADVVRAVELLALELLRDDLARPVGALADERRGHVLADEQVEVGVVRHPVALVREVPHLDDGAVRRVLAADVARHVGEEEVLVLRVPDRPFREREAGRHALDLRAFLDELVDRFRLRLDPEACLGARHRAPFRGGMVGATLIRSRSARAGGHRVRTPPTTAESRLDPVARPDPARPPRPRRRTAGAHPSAPRHGSPRLHREWRGRARRCRDRAS